MEYGDDRRQCGVRNRDNGYGAVRNLAVHGRMVLTDSCYDRCDNVAFWKGDVGSERKGRTAGGCSLCIQVHYGMSTASAMIGFLGRCVMQIWVA